MLGCRSPSGREVACLRLWCRVWAASRKDRSRQHRALHGNLKVVVVNITALSNLRLALAGGPDVALLQEVRATKQELLAEAKVLGYMAAVGPDELCLAAVLFRPGRGQEMHLHCSGEWCSRTAAVIIDFGDGYACCMASVYDHDGPTVA